MPTRTKTKAEAATPALERKTEKKGKTSKVGNLCRDPELRFAPTGLAVASARIAVEEPKEAGNWAGERETFFYDLSVFGDMGEHFATSCTKGQRVVVMGRAEVDTWTDAETGEVRTAKRIVADAIGPDLRWATATITKATRTGPAGANVPDYSDEEPF